MRPTPPRGARVRVAAVAAALSLLVTGCGDLQFIDDDSLTITFPPDRSVVALPVRLTWDAAPLVEGQRYAVFVDRTPQRPGQTIEEAFDAEERAGIHVTDDTELLLTQVAIRGGVPTRESDRHEATVIVLDADGRRLGERADVITFDVHRGDA